MKKICSYALLFTLTLLMTSCGGKKVVEEEVTEEGTQTYCYKDSCQFVALNLSLELPLGKDSVSVQVRDSLIAHFVRSVSQQGVFAEDDTWLKPFDGGNDEPQALVDYYGKAVYEKLLETSRTEYEERMAYLEEDTTMTEEEKENIKRDIPMWSYELTIKKSIDTERLMVYDSETYCYYGGAHGGMLSSTLTFAKDSGTKVERFIKADATAALQPLLRRGLIQYYSEAGESITDAELSERLQIEGTMVPQPQDTPRPNATADSLTFTYGQYEIACYADGMPSFTIAVKDLQPYLTPETKALLEKETGH